MHVLVYFGAATALGVALLAPIEHMAGRWAGALVALVTAAGIARSAGSVVMLAISERSEPFGVPRAWLHPPAIALARGAGIAAAFLLTASPVARFRARDPQGALVAPGTIANPRRTLP